MIGRCALGRAPLLPCPKSLEARASFGCDHRCSFHIDDVNIHLTGVAFPGNRIFTLSTFSGALQARVFRACSIAIATWSRGPGSPPGSDRGGRPNRDQTTGGDALMTGPDLSTAPVSNLVVVQPTI